MLPRPVRHQVSVVGGGGVGHCSGASGVEVTQVVGEDLQLVSGELTVVPQHLVVTGSAGALDPLVTQQIEVSLGGMVDPMVNHSPSQSVAVLVLVVISWEKPRKLLELNNTLYLVTNLV